MSQIVASKLDNVDISESHEISVNGGSVYCFFKRVLDVVLSLIALIILIN